MNKCFAVLIYLIVFAGSLSAQDGGAIFTQSYSYSDVDNSFWAERLTDDFIPDFSGDVQHVVLWMVYKNTQPADIFLRITEDDGSNNPNTATLIASWVSPATHVVGYGRKRGIPVLEYFDEIGFTRREEDGRVLMTD